MLLVAAGQNLCRSKIGDRAAKESTTVCAKVPFRRTEPLHRRAQITEHRQAGGWWRKLLNTPRRSRFRLALCDRPPPCIEVGGEVVAVDDGQIALIDHEFVR